MANAVRRCGNVTLDRVGERVVRFPERGTFLSPAGDLYVDGEHVATRTQWSDDWGLWYATLTPPCIATTVNADERGIDAIVAAVQARRADPAYREVA